MKLGYTTSDSDRHNSRTLNYGATFKKKILEARHRLAFFGVRGEFDSVAVKDGEHGYDNFIYNYMTRQRFLDSKTTVNLRKRSLPALNLTEKTVRMTEQVWE